VKKGVVSVFRGLALALLLAGCAAQPETRLDFGVLGDVPYTDNEVGKLDALIGRMNAQPLAFVVHLGDLGSSAKTRGCSDAWLEARRDQLANIRHPLIVLPGDNEWTDCAKHGMDAGARLARWRALFCMPPEGLALERQPGQCENVRWRSGGMAFIGLNVPGGSNPDLADARMAATLEWLDESLSVAEGARATRIFVFLHADPRFERVGDEDAYARLRAVLRTHAQWFAGRLVLVHGDLHTYRLDEPVPGLRRIEVWGSPLVSWLHITAAGDRLRIDADW
jgi:hypothetical protein